MTLSIHDVLPRASAAAALVAALVAGFGSGEAKAWSLEEAAKPYAGTEVRGICDGYSPCLAYIELAKEFEQKTGIKVNFEVADLLAIQTKFLTDQITGSDYYDLVEVISFSLGVFPQQGLVTDWATFIDNPALKDPEVNFDKDLVPTLYDMQTHYDGHLYSVPTKYTLAYEVLRQDLVTDEEKANFKAKYGYDMPLPPTEWQQYYDLAQFYTRKKGETLAGKVLDKDFYGTIVAFKRHLTVLYDYERVLLGMGGSFTDADGNVTIDEGDTGVKALEYLLSLRPYSIPSYMEATWDEEYAEMCNGNVFIMFTWGDTTPFLEIPADCPASAGNMLYFPHPGTHNTVAEGNEWMIPKSARNAEAAWLFVQWLNRKDIQAKTMPMGGNPSRSDVVRMPEWQAPDWPNRQREQVEIWLEDNDKLVIRPAPPAWLAWSDLIMEEFSAAGAGQQTAEETIKKVAQRMREAAAQ